MDRPNKATYATDSKLRSSLLRRLDSRDHETRLEALSELNSMSSKEYFELARIVRETLPATGRKCRLISITAAVCGVTALMALWVLSYYLIFSHKLVPVALITCLITLLASLPGVLAPFFVMMTKRRRSRLLLAPMRIHTTGKDGSCRVLAELDEAGWLWDRTTQDALTAALKAAEDDDELSVGYYRRVKLARILASSATGLDLKLQILELFGRIGGAEALPIVTTLCDRKVENADQNKIRMAAREHMPAIVERVRLAGGEGALLRASDRPNLKDTVELLRPPVADDSLEAELLHTVE